LQFVTFLLPNFIFFPKYGKILSYFVHAPQYLVPRILLDFKPKIRYFAVRHRHFDLAAPADTLRPVKYGTSIPIIYKKRAPGCLSAKTFAYTNEE